jgi:hypothetical protein
MVSSYRNCRLRTGLVAELEYLPVTANAFVALLTAATIQKPREFFLDLYYPDVAMRTEPYVVAREYLDDYNNAVLFLSHPQQLIEIFVEGYLDNASVIAGLKADLRLPYTYQTFSIREDLQFNGTNEPLLCLLFHLKILSPSRSISQLMSVITRGDIVRYCGLVQQAAPNDLDRVAEDYYQELLKLRPDLIAGSMFWLSTDSYERRQLRGRYQAAELPRLQELRTQQELWHWIVSFPVTSPLCFGDYGGRAFSNLLHESGLPFVRDVEHLTITIDEEREVLQHPERFLHTMQELFTALPVGLRVLDVTVRYKGQIISHANLLLFDDVERTLELFDPHGSVQSPEINEILEELCQKYDHRYLSPRTLCLNQRLQRLAGTPNECPVDSGYCKVLTSLYLHCRLLAPQQLIVALLDFPQLPLLIQKYLTWLSVMLS